MLEPTAFPGQETEAQTIGALNLCHHNKKTVITFLGIVLENMLQKIR